MMLERWFGWKSSSDDARVKGRAVLDGTGPGGQLPQAEYRAYADAEARVAAEDLSRFVGVPAEAARGACRDVATKLAEELAITQQLDELGQDFVEATRRLLPMNEFLKLAGATRDDVHVARLEDLMPRVHAHLLNDWKGLGLDGRDMAEVALNRAGEQFRAMNAGEIVALLKDHGLPTRIGFDPKRLGLASAKPAEDLARIYDVEVKAADDRRGTAGLAAIVGMMLVDKVARMHIIANQHAKKAPLLQPLEKREDMLSLTDLLRKRYKAGAAAENGADKALLGYTNAMFEVASRLEEVRGRLVK